LESGTVEGFAKVIVGPMPQCLETVSLDDHAEGECG